LVKLAFGEEHVHGLSYVSSMQVIVVLDLLTIA